MFCRSLMEAFSHNASYDRAKTAYFPRIKYLYTCINFFIKQIELLKSQLYCLPVGYLTPYPYTNPFLDLLNISFLKRSLLDAVSKIKDSMERLYLCTVHEQVLRV